MGSSSGETDGLSQSRQSKLLSPLTTAYLIVASVLLCLSNLMLPVENGLPPFRLAGAPVMLPMVTAGFLAMLLALRSPMRFVRLMSAPYAVGQCAMIGFIFAESFLLGDIPLSVLCSVGMFTTFVLNYILIVDILRLGGRKIFTKAVCVFAGLAALVGIYELAFGHKLPIYQALDALYWLSRKLASGPRGTMYDMRVTGTLGNSIVYAAAMMLVLPFIAELPSKVLRRVLFALVLSAACSTLSRTIVLFGGVFAIGYLIVEKGRAVRRTVAVGLAAVVVVTIIGTSMISSNELVSRWTSRFDEEEQMGESGGVNARLSLIGFVLDASFNRGDALDFAFGRGFLSSNEIGLKFSDTLETVDNAYATILYEHGMFGLMAYLAFWAWLIRRTARFASSDYHWYSVVGLMLTGMSFVTYRFCTINFIAVASIAMMMTSRQRDKNAEPDGTPCR